MPIEPTFAPRREEGIFVILQREPGRVWTYLELHEEFKRRGMGQSESQEGDRGDLPPG